MRIGITECGDAGLDTSWQTTINNGDGAVLITKNITDKFINAVLATQNTKPITVHATVTGWGGTVIEPNVPAYTKQLNQLKKLIDAGFPTNRAVIRIDPIIPIQDGLERVTKVLDEAERLNLIPELRVRISIMDNYPHVRERFKKKNLPVLYNGQFTPPAYVFEDVIKTLTPYGEKEINFETCAEPFLAGKKPWMTATGCLSIKDLENMDLPTDVEAPACGQRSTCLCLGFKYQLLDPRTNRHPCAHGCIYCYWKDA